MKKPETLAEFVHSSPETREALGQEVVDAAILAQRAKLTLYQIHQVDPLGTKDTRMSFLCPGSEPKEHK